MNTKKKMIFAPGCALTLYKSYYTDSIFEILYKNLGVHEMSDKCCRNQPQFEVGMEVINICPGCDKRYRNNYQNITTISLWEVLAETDFLKFPDYNGREMSIMDACPTRDQDRIHNAIRTLISKMNIKLIEPKNTRRHSVCCGDTFYGVLPVEQVKNQMIKRANEMPVDDVIVYCVSCTKSVFIGGKKPHYLIDLLFNEESLPLTLEPDDWHLELENYIKNH